MELQKDTIITLENKERYIVKNITFYGGIKYALAQKEDNENKIILEEILDNNELFVQEVSDEELTGILLRILEV